MIFGQTFCRTRQILLAHRNKVVTNSTRSAYFKFKRTRTPPLQEARESPYIVGPHLKPEYVPRTFITDPIKYRHDDDLDHFIYEPTRVDDDPDRKVKLLLINDVEGLGVAGQVVEVSYKLGAAMLVAMRRADYATEFAMSWHKFGPKTIQSASTALSPRTCRLLKSQIFNLPTTPNVNIEPWHISLALRLAGCVCPKEAIEPDSIERYTDDNNTDGVKCTIKVNNHERVEVKFAYSKSLDDNKI